MMDKLKFAGRRKLLVMPILILPFITLAFWALGGGKTVSKQASQATGLNLELPEARPKIQNNESKLSFYEEAERDSASVKEAMKKDPYFQSIAETASDVFVSDSSLDDPSESVNFRKDQDVNEERVYAKIRELKQHMKESSSMQTLPVIESPESPSVNEAGKSDFMKVNSADKDSDMIALNSILDKIITIQHPEKLEDKEANADSGNEKNIFKVTSYQVGGDQSYFGSINQWESQAAFYGLGDTLNDHQGNLIPAQVEEDQKLYSGSILKIRLLQDMYVGDEKVRKGSFIYGEVSIGDNRVNIDVSSIRFGQSILPVHLMVYDIDGLPGIHMPGGRNKASLKQTSQTGLQGLDLSSLDPSLKARATTAGIHAVKSWVNQKTKEQKVFVKDGYLIFLNVKN